MLIVVLIFLLNSLTQIKLGYTTAQNMHNLIVKSSIPTNGDWVYVKFNIRISI